MSNPGPRKAIFSRSFLDCIQWTNTKRFENGGVVLVQLVAHFSWSGKRRKVQRRGTARCLERSPNPARDNCAGACPREIGNGTRQNLEYKRHGSISDMFVHDDLLVTQ